MNCTESSARSHDYVDGKLSASDARALETHVAHCAACRRQLESLRALMASAANLPKDIAPSRDLWSDLRLEMERLDAASLRPSAAQSQPDRFRPNRSDARSSFLQWFAPLAIAASVALLATVAERRFAPRDNRPAWSVANLAGAPSVDAVTFEREAKLRVGQWLETDAASRARVTIGSVGEVTVDPNSRLRLKDMGETDHRLELARGTLSAFISAPPRIFFVDTPSATAVDLGCAYTLTVDDHGDGELHVTTGYVSLEHGDRESIIPSGAMCITRRDSGPGTPFAEDAPGALRTALKRFDFERGAAAAALPEILAQARAEDAVTLWHLLARTEGTERAEVFDKLAQYQAPPAGVTRAGILAGDAAMRRSWATALGLGTF